MSKDAFEPVPSPFNFSQAEKDIIAFWKEGQTYHKSLAQRADAPRPGSWTFLSEAKRTSAWRRIRTSRKLRQFESCTVCGTQ